MERTAIIFALILAIVIGLTWFLLTQSVPAKSVKWDRSYDTAIPLSPYSYKDRFTVLRPRDESLPTRDYVIHAWREWLEGDLDQAVLLYQIGYMYDPNNVFALRDIGDLCYENEQFTLACNYYNQYQAYFPDQASSYIYWGRSLFKANYLQEAERVLKDPKVRQGKRGVRIWKRIIEPKPIAPSGLIFLPISTTFEHNPDITRRRQQPHRRR